MEAFTIGIVGSLMLVLILILGVHVSVALGMVGLVGMFFLVGPDASIYTSATLAFGCISNYSLVIIPLYVMMGILAQESGLSSGAYECLRIWMGRFRAGLAIATVGACTLFGTLCGSSLVTASVFAQVSAPEMRRLGYEKRFAYGVCSSGGVIGMLIPPSVLIVVYGILTQESIGQLLIAGISPGIMLFLLFSLAIVLITFVKSGIVPIRSMEKVTWHQRLSSIKLIWGIALTVGIIFGGIFFGVFSPSEAGAVACVVLLIIYSFSNKFHVKGLTSAILGTVSTSAMIFLILIGAGIFSRFLVLSTVAPRVLEVVTSINLSPVVFLAVVCAGYMILGCFFDSISMLSITLPLLHPAAMKLGIAPMHFAMVAIISIEIGLITPPVGLNVYAVKGVAEEDVTLEDLFAGVLPFFFMMLICVALYILFPGLSTFLPDMIISK
ncbi:MAG: TRAP transporter large permease [Pseudomonadota bacterium]